jgi:DNA primase catalytic core
MARIPETELERLKAEVSVERLAEAAGIELTKNGKDRVGKCPFHADGEASLVVSPGKNLFHCFGCGAAGGPIDWTMRIQAISFRHAVELLRSDLGVSGGSAAPVKASSIRRLPPPVAFDADDQALLRQVIDYYHETIKTAPEAMEYLRARGLAHPEVIDRFRLGYANRTLGYSLPGKGWKAGGEIRGKLAKIGVYRESGHEHFTGSLVIPILDEEGNVQEVYGRKILNNLRKGTPYHMYLPGPHKGVWNIEAVRGSKEIILCEALIDALTFWCAGYRNVTAAYGVEGFTPDHLEAFQRYGTERVLIAYDRDDAGDRAAEKLAQKLMDRGIACYRIEFPKGMDANDFAQKVAPAAKSLGLAIRSAVWLGNGKAPERPKLEMPLDPAFPEADRSPEGGEAAKKETAPRVRPGQGVPAPAPVSPLAAAPQAPPEAVKPSVVEDVALPASPVPPPPGDGLPVETQGKDLLMVLEDRAYRIRGWEKPLNPETLKVNVMVTRGEHFHVDTLDLYQAKARAGFIRQASLELSESEEALKRDLGKVLRKVEEIQADQLAEALAAKEQKPSLTEEEHAEALALLKTPDLMGRILQDFEALGVVGEEPNKLTGYLASVSRLLDRPLALLIQSASAAGKSSLMDAVLDLVPEEDVIRYSAMSGQSLFYMGDRALQHKILAIAEEEGARQASYALKLLQSEGRVTMASTGKDPATGMLATHDYTVEGPVMLFLTTTAINLDEELLNRCLVLSVNESREQTRAIHVLQRQRETLEGLLAKTERERLLRLHRNAQRLLQPLSVVNPYAAQLSFRDDQTRSRRDHVKYLTLIRSIALLHQFQRDIKTHGSLRYIEVIPEDIALANELAQEVLGRTVDELLPQTRKLLTLLHAWVKAECERLDLAQVDFHFTRRQAREATGWGDTQLRIHLDRLMEMEFLLPHRGRRGQSYLYELLHQGEDGEGRMTCLGLSDGSRLRAVAPDEAMTATSRGEEESSRGQDPNLAGGSRPVRGGVAGGSRGVVLPLESLQGEGSSLLEPTRELERGTLSPFTPVVSYPQMAHVNGNGR